MNISTLTQKGQLVIPSVIRKSFGLQKGDKISFIIQNGQLILKPIEKNYFKSFQGILKTKGKVLKSLLKEKK